jgi:hypothetical protein
MRAVKEENSPNYNLKQLEGTSVGDLKAECHRSYLCCIHGIFHICSFPILHSCKVWFYSAQWMQRRLKCD